ncbi:hypothetical protein [Streptomyces sp. NPDC087300]|uniref:hypothetical protein n=1 Tax=Streptomyces sp. NPDC087300 TaxID=3365780 RepID=UPI00380DA370
MRRRRMTTALGALAAAAALALSVPSSAYAAQGVLVVNGAAYEDPSGCYPVDRFPSAVTNHTDAIAEVHTGPGCTGQVEWLVYPGETYHTETAQSVFVL